MSEEAMERVIISVTPEDIKPEGGAGLNATGNLTRSGPLSPSNSDEKIQSRYLRPSMGSCHDFCKHGKKHASEEGKYPNLGTFLRNKIVRDREQNQVRGPNLGERRKKRVIMPKATSQLEIELPDKPEVSKPKTPLPTKKSIASGEKKTLLTSRDNNGNPVKSLNPSDGKKTQVMKLRTPLQPKSSNKPNVIKPKDYSPASEIDASNESDIIKKKTKLPVKKPITSVTPKVIKQKAPPSVKKSTQNIKQKATLPPKRVDVPAKPATYLKTKTPLISAKPSFSLKTKTPLIRSISQLKSSRSLIIRRNQENKIIKGLGTSKVGEKKVLKPPTASLFSKIPCEVVSSLKPRKLRNVKCSSSVKKKEKVGKANTELKSVNRGLDPNQNIESSESAITEVSDEEIKGKNKIEVSKGEDKRRLRKTSTAHPVDNTSTPYKLKFRRGKVIDLRSESIGARRLWFSIGRLVGENPKGNGEVRRRSFRRKRDIGGSGSNGPNSEVQSVVLKHQDMKEKKDAQALFNHVIEETASKLVEARKSKVKALVGAFETVISLQESKPTSAV